MAPPLFISKAES